MGYDTQYYVNVYPRHKSIGNGILYYGTVCSDYVHVDSLPKTVYVLHGVMGDGVYKCLAGKVWHSFVLAIGSAVMYIHIRFLK